MDKIPASIGILTLNSGKTLRACLESVKDFAEIIICDGNSTDNTLEIAREYGAKIIKQYDSDEPNLSCVTDKANVRQKNMNAASYDWYFFMDSDDTLSPEVITEIRAAVTPPIKGGGGGVEQEILVWRMPTRIFIDGREIKHASFYPSYQIRLFNRKTGAYFRGPVHDRITFDAKKYRVGTFKNFYNYEWTGARLKNIWPFLKKYVGWEVQTAAHLPLWRFISVDIFRPLKSAFGHLFYRIPKTYLRYGFKDSAPFRLEFYLIVWYQIYLAWRLIIKRIKGCFETVEKL